MKIMGIMGKFFFISLSIFVATVPGYNGLKMESWPELTSVKGTVNGEIIVGEPPLPRNLVKLLPSSHEIKGWELQQPPGFFKSDNLWKYINGAAENYLSYDFQQVVTAEYINSQGSIMVVDVYQFSTPLNAFGIYSSERASGYSFIDIGGQGYMEGASLNFWKDRYYIKIICFDESEKSVQDVILTGRIISDKIKGVSELPSILQLFPGENLIPNSERYFARDVLGLQFLTNGYTADYSIGKQKVTLFIIDTGSPEQSKRIFESYKEYVSEYGVFQGEIKGIGDEAFTGKDSFYGTLTAFRIDKLMGGVLSLGDTRMAVELIGKIITNRSRYVRKR